MQYAGGNEFNDKLGVQNTWLLEFTKEVEKVLKLAIQEFYQVCLENMTNYFLFSSSFSVDMHHKQHI